MKKHKNKMQVYDFTLILGNATELTAEMADALFEAGCDDGSPGSCEGVVSIDMHREAENLEGAIRSAIGDVQKAGYTVAYVRIDANASVLQSA